MEVFPYSPLASYFYSAQVELISFRMIISHWQLEPECFEPAQVHKEFNLIYTYTPLQDFTCQPAKIWRIWSTLHAFSSHIHTSKYGCNKCTIHFSCCGFAAHFALIAQPWWALYNSAWTIMSLPPPPPSVNLSRILVWRRKKNHTFVALNIAN